MARSTTAPPKKTVAIIKGRFPKEPTTPTELGAAGQRIAKKTRDSSHFGANDTFAADLDKASGDLTAAEKTVEQLEADLKEAVTTRNVALTTFHVSVESFVNHINAVAKGDEQLISASGLEVATPTASHATTDVAPAPTGLTARPGSRPGDVDLDWDPSTGAYSYVIEQSPDGQTNWVMVGAVTKAKATMSARPSGQKLWFRIAVVNPMGTGPTCPGVAVTVGG